ncbi:MAG: SUMF1/EgtB/PvdO family nonheme iron enzyme [Chitinispirillales bacterium]|jgi:formylglycine-generating enzyme required for sulfatase activity|nr:SUMF1/EgtB/PvdO family nonheme iron enzyme [Chitinispirillales bacterium]
MLASLINSGRYIGIERSNAFLAEIEREQVKQRSGAIDDNQISELGRQFGVDYICIADITPAFGEFQVSARIVDVETAVVVFIGDAFSPLRTPDDLTQVSEEVIKNMFSRQATMPKPEPAAPSPLLLPPVVVTQATGAGTGTGDIATVENVVRSGEAEIDMVFVRGGTFDMGCTDEQSGCRRWEKPVRSVTVSDFYISKYVVTQALWRAVMGENRSMPKKFRGDDSPVVNVRWRDVQEFLTRLNETTGKQFRLPTEAEWEYAARGGTQSRGYMYAGSNNIDDVAWHKGNSGKNIPSVGGKMPNELGIYDMSGNVFELVSDRFGWYGSSSEINPEGPGSGSGHTIRGGSWRGFSEFSQNSYRNGIFHNGVPFTSTNMRPFRSGSWRWSIPLVGIRLAHDFNPDVVVASLEKPAGGLTQTENGETGPRGFFPRSIGGGTYFTNNRGIVGDWGKGGIDGRLTYNDGGIYIFFTEVFGNFIVGFSAGISFGSANLKEEDEWDRTVISNFDVPFTSVGFGSCFRVPIHLSRNMIIFPFILEGHISYISQLFSKKTEFDFGGIRINLGIGVGADFNLSERTFLRPELLYGWGVDELVFRNENRFNGMGHGLTLKLSSGFRF